MLPGNRETSAEESDQEIYNEAEDEDFSPEQQDAQAGESSSSEDEDEGDVARQNKKRKTNETAEELDSGDEATIRERKSKKRRKEGHATSDDEGGLIKTRSQRLAEKVERKQQKKSAGGRVTIDVDAEWANLINLPVGQPASAMAHVIPSTDDKENQPSLAENFVRIKRRIKFAGQITEVEEQVPHDSAEAQAYLAEQSKSEPDPATAKDEEASSKEKVNRPLRRMSLFEPNPLGIVKGVAPEKLRRKAPTRTDMLMAEHRAAEEQRKKAEKLTTMQKTALDWKGFVVEQGLGDELQEYGKSKKGFLAREQFLDRVHGANEVARRTARLKT